jgi:tight adherence protein B
VSAYAPILLTVTLLGAVALTVSLFVDAQPAGRDDLVRRARALRTGRVQGPRTPQERAFRRGGGGRLDALALRLMPRPAVLRARLEATGHKLGIGQYAAACAAVALASMSLALLIHAPLILALLEGAATGLWLPHAVVGLMGRRRRGKFFKLFPEAIGLIVRGLRAGLPVTESISTVGREIADPVGEEFRKVADQVRLGVGLEEAMWQTARRLGLPEFNFLVISLSVQRETGGNLAETLENLEQIIRRRRQMRLKIKAMSSEGVASALIIGALPFITAAIIGTMNPHYLGLLFTTALGKLMLMFAFACLAIGGLVMWRMIRFEI